MKVAYVRVSSCDQNDARQCEALGRYDIEKWFCEKISGKNTDRPKLQEMLDFVREGDIVYVHDFSRLARSTKDLLNIAEQLKNKGVSLISNKENIDTSTASGKLMLTMIAAISEFERQNLLERQQEGILIAKREGKFRGRQIKRITDEMFSNAYEKYNSRKINKGQFASELKISRPTLDRLIKVWNDIGSLQNR